MTQSTKEKLAAEGERAAAMLAHSVANATDEEFTAMFDGVLRGLSAKMIQRFGAERAYEIVQSHADVLDRALLDGRPAVKPRGSCGGD